MVRRGPGQATARGRGRAVGRPRRRRSSGRRSTARRSTSRASPASRSSSTSGVRAASRAATSSRSSRRSCRSTPPTGSTVVGVLTDDPVEPARDFVAAVRRRLADGRRPGQGDQGGLSRRRPAADLLRRPDGRHPLHPDRRADRRRLRAPVRQDRVDEPAATRWSSSTGWSSATARGRSSTACRSTVAAGELVALLGPNGAGKTTTVEIVEGYRRAGRRPGQRPGRRTRRRGGPALRARVGLMLQGGGIDPRAQPRETLRQYGRFHADPRDAGRAAGPGRAAGGGADPLPAAVRRRATAARSGAGARRAARGRRPRRADGRDGPGGAGRDPGDRRGPARRGRGDPADEPRPDRRRAAGRPDRASSTAGGSSRPGRRTSWRPAPRHGCGSGWTGRSARTRLADLERRSRAVAARADASSPTATALATGVEGVAPDAALVAALAGWCADRGPAHRRAADGRRQPRGRLSRPGRRGEPRSRAGAA